MLPRLMEFALLAFDQCGKRDFELIDGRSRWQTADSRINAFPASNGNAYDFSVEGDENFIAGMGGICAHTIPMLTSTEAISARCC